jgi:agmatine/peptidylarginine deiminase
MKPKNLPAELGYYIPAKWEPHEATWFQWPRDHLYKSKTKVEKVK